MVPERHKPSQHKPSRQPMYMLEIVYFRHNPLIGRSHEQPLPLRVARAVREKWPDALPLFSRFSAIDWRAGGRDIQWSVPLAKQLKEIGVDLIDCSSGFAVPNEKIPFGPGFQVHFAAKVRSEAEIAGETISFITEPIQAEHIVATGQADVVLLERQMLRDPYWPLHAAKMLSVDIPWPDQYLRAKLP